jgi:hypothetical protein
MVNPGPQKAQRCARIRDDFFIFWRLLARVAIVGLRQNHARGVRVDDFRHGLRGVDREDAECGPSEVLENRFPRTLGALLVRQPTALDFEQWIAARTRVEPHEQSSCFSWIARGIAQLASRQLASKHRLAVWSADFVRAGEHWRRR